MLRGKPAFGDEPPLLVDRRRKPDRRQVSLRWLAGTLLTAVTSSALMGIALSAALEGGAGVSRPSHFSMTPDARAEIAEKGARVVATAVPLTSSHQVVELTTMVRDGDHERVSMRPFALVNMLLAARHPTTLAYPSFDPLAIMTEDADTEEVQEEEDRPTFAATQIYGDKSENEVALRIFDFAFDADSYEQDEGITSEEAELLVRQTMPALRSEPVQVASLSRIDPFRFGFSNGSENYEPGSAFRVIQENVSFEPSDEPNAGTRFYEEVLPVRQETAVADALAGIADRGIATERAAKALGELLQGRPLKSGYALRMGIETRGDEREIVRLSAYRGKRHVGTVAETQEGVFEEANPPEMAESVAAIFEERESEAPIRSDMPTVYDGIFQAGLAYGFDVATCEDIIRTIASETDLQSRLSPSDRLSVFYMMDEGEAEAEGASSSDILSISLQLGNTERTLYRFKPKGADHADYFDAEGRSARQFLLRKPVTQGRFTSGFSTGRKHPVLGYNRPHWGVDWAAPGGTPILAAGNGTVTEVGWKSGYGRHTEIKHANGYATTYSHQSGFGKGMKVGTKVTQGQVIGYVGSTGLSTGNHLHFEIEVNGKKVDPMRIKVGAETVLTGDDLTTFTQERERIETLIEERFEMPQIASN